MNFKDFYPFLLYKGLFDKASESHIAPQDKKEIDSLFKDLEKLEDTLHSDKSAQEEILQRCSTLIAKHQAKDTTLSKYLLFAIFAAKMEIYHRLDRRDDISREYAAFSRAEQDAKGNILTTEQQRFIDTSAMFNSAELKEILITKLAVVLDVKKDVKIPDLNVADILASSSFVCGDIHNLQRIRRIFHELWQVESLQPLMTFAAYAALGNFVDSDNEVTKEYPLMLIFSDEPLEDSTFGIQYKNMVMVSLSDKDDDKEYSFLSDSHIKDTITHELYHFFARVFYRNNALPYKADESAAMIQVLDKMVAEAASITDTHSITQISRYYEILVATRKEPFESFSNLESSYKPEKLHAEVVVRTPAALAAMHKDCGEAESLEIMRRSGLNCCVDFFLREVELTKIAVSALEKEMNKKLAKPGAEFCEVPHYAKYRSTELHDAVRSNDPERLRELLKGDRNLAETDSFNENALQLAMSSNKPALVFEFAQSAKVIDYLYQNIPLLQRVLFYLVDLAKDETSEFSSQALAIFKQANIAEQNFPVMNKAFFSVREKILDANLVKDLETLPMPEILAQIGDGRITYYDKFGNSIRMYFAAAERPELMDEVLEHYYPSIARGEFIEPDIMRLQLRRKEDPIKFLVELKERAKEEDFNPLKLMEMSANHDTLVEHVALRCKLSTLEGGKKAWFEVFKYIMVEFNINPEMQAAQGSDPLIEILPEEFRQEAKAIFKKAATPAPKTKVREKSPTEDRGCVLS
jgi:hypothetical protein